jgi:hypothetical protein
VGQPFTAVHIAEGLADRNFNDKIRHGQDDLCNQHGYQSDGPQTSPRKPWQRRENYSIQGVACGM